MVCARQKIFVRTHLRYFGTSSWCCGRSLLRRLTGNNVSGHYVRHYFLFTYPSCFLGPPVGHFGVFRRYGVVGKTNENEWGRTMKQNKQTFGTFFPLLYRFLHIALLVNKLYSRPDKIRIIFYFSMSIFCGNKTLNNTHNEKLNESGNLFICWIWNKIIESLNIV